MPVLQSQSGQALLLCPAAVHKFALQSNLHNPVGGHP